jgi:predicted LPLAT superfamily acyltransferase
MLRFVAFYYFLFSFSSSREIYSFFRKRLGYNRVAALGKVYRNYFVFGQTLIDKIVLMSGIPNKFSFDFDGEHFLHAMTAGGKGGLLISAHVGNWEIAGFLLKRIDTRTNIVMFDGEHRQIKEYLDKVMTNRQVNIIVVKDDLSHIYEISEALQNNEFVCMHADRFIEGNRTVKKDFLGAAAHFPVGPFVLAATLQVAVSFVFALKESKLHYHFYASPPKVYPVGERKMQHESMMVDFIAELEAKIEKYPTQWFNYYNFWKD